MAVIETTYREALRQALIDAMNEDPSIIIMGEEVGRYGGAYGVTKGMLEMFGENRVIDTPISEPGIVGAGIGAAMTGLRPVVELMYVDFAGLDHGPDGQSGRQEPLHVWRANRRAHGAALAGRNRTLRCRPAFPIT